MLYEKKKKDTFVAENAGNPLGEMLEWLKRHAWKACIRQQPETNSHTISCVATHF